MSDVASIKETDRLENLTAKKEDGLIHENLRLKLIFGKLSLVVAPCLSGPSYKCGCDYG